jgi:hypothetical protein
MGRIERANRITQRKSGVWGTSSQDLLMVVSKLFRLSEQEARSRPDTNTSRYVYAGIPLLLAAAHSFTIEYFLPLNTKAS